MVTIITTLIICATVVLCTFKICRTWKPVIPVQQQYQTAEEIAKQLDEADKDKVPNFQDVIDAINKEFLGVEDENEE